MMQKVFDPANLTKKAVDKIGGKGKSAPAQSQEAATVMAMGEEEAKRRRMRTAASAGTILGDAEKFGG
jgi:hypothetical protein